eukprot:gb/GFBE01078969.1/.p1 GENE.gb/GFBE01078969.1/~~gb/GFBE01078969.1/.p1  ORF type:complete len:467 (+),score=40.91 gb/GFBE01078969.1/:1-1401(+)
MLQCTQALQVRAMAVNSGAALKVTICVLVMCCKLRWPNTVPRAWLQPPLFSGCRLRGGSRRSGHSCRSLATAKQPCPEQDSSERSSLLNHWWPVLFMSEFQKKSSNGKPVPTELFGETIVLYEAGDGSLVAAQNRCLHMSMPLELGFVSRGCLQCSYHGWSYGQDGDLAMVPTWNVHEGRKRLSLPCYPTRVVDGVIWLYPGDPKLLDLVSPPPEIRSSLLETDGFYLHSEITLPVASASWDLALANGLDISHVRWAHPWSPKGLELQQLSRSEFTSWTTSGVKDIDDGRGISETFEINGATGTFTVILPATEIVEPWGEPEAVSVVYYVPTSEHTSTRFASFYFRNWAAKLFPTWLLDIVIKWFDREDVTLIEGCSKMIKAGSPQFWVPDTKTNKLALRLKCWIDDQGREKPLWFEGYSPGPPCKSGYALVKRCTPSVFHSQRAEVPKDKQPVLQWPFGPVPGFL